jgi:pyruvate dehydrogenase E2 component (dihydrolipoamide acetyltransferase)
VLAAEKAPAASKSAASIGALNAKGPIQEERTVPVSNMRGAIARRLLESKTQLPHFYLEIEIDASPLLALREQLNTALRRRS